MYQGRIELSANDILEKEFKIDPSGYRMKEVDQFLDTVIKDYNEFYTIIKTIEKERKQLLEENSELRQELRNLKSGIAAARGNDKELTKRIKDIGILHGINLIDHIIIGKGNYYSFYQDNNL